MKRIIKLENEDYFNYNLETSNIEMSGELTGSYILSNIKCNKFQVIFCPDNKEILLIKNKLK